MTESLLTQNLWMESLDKNLVIFFCLFIEANVCAMHSCGGAIFAYKGQPKRDAVSY